MAAPKTKDEREATARADVRAALAPRSPLAAPEPVAEVLVEQLAKALARIEDLEARVAALEGR